jgi:hypothetical protein
LVTKSDNFYFFRHQELIIIYKSLIAFIILAKKRDWFFLLSQNLHYRYKIVKLIKYLKFAPFVLSRYCNTINIIYKA